MIAQRFKSFLAREAITIGVLALVFVGLVAFLQIASGVRSGRSTSMDETIMRSMRSENDSTDPLGPKWVEEMSRDVTALGGIPFMAFLVIVSGGMLLFQGKYETVLLLVFAMIGSLCLSFALKHGFDRPRPSLVPHETQVFSRSFPSSHSMMATATYLTLAVIVARVRPKMSEKVFLIALAVIVVVLIGISRIYLGVHWPTDVLAGWVAGGVWAVVCWALAKWTQRLRQQSPSPGYESEET